MDKNRRNLILAGVGLYLLSAIISGALFSYLGKEALVISPSGQSATDDQAAQVASGPKDQECPINGAYFTQTEKDIWETRRPLTVMIENSLDARPQSGLSRADVIYEAVAEGGITRFLAVFYCGAALESAQDYDVGPVRSARTYFLDWASEYADYPLYAHVGGAGDCGDSTVYDDAKALCQIRQYDWLDDGTWGDLNQFSLSYNQCRRDTRLGADIATEHTMYCDTDALWEKAADRGLTNETEVNGDEWDEDFRSWSFKEEEKLADRGDIGDIDIYFWSNQSNYDVTWQYDKETNLYSRYNAGQVHADYLTGNVLQAKTIIVQLTKETGPVDEHKHLLYDTIGEGDLLVFQDGQVTEGTWEKNSRTTRTRFFNESGAEIRLNRGLIWIEIVPAGNTISY
jgi:hypothetical protein